jgi:DNA-binding NarL/FixJ family response regulator
MGDVPGKVLIVDDSYLIASLFGKLIDEQEDLRCVGTLPCADQLSSAVESLQPDIVLLDISMPGRDPFDAARELTAVHPEVRVVGFSGYDDPQTMKSLAQSGGCAFVSKADGPQNMIEAIRRVWLESRLLDPKERGDE